MGVYGEEEQESMATSDNPVRKRIWDEMIRSNELPGNQIWNLKKMFKYGNTQHKLQKKILITML